MPDHAKEPSEKQEAQDSALIELLIALANRRGPDSRGRSRLSRSLQRGETGRCAIATSRGSSATAQITVAWRLPTPNGTFGGVNPARLVTLVCIAQVGSQIGAYTWPALLPEFLADWPITNGQAGW